MVLLLLLLLSFLLLHTVFIFSWQTLLGQRVVVRHLPDIQTFKNMMEIGMCGLKYFLLHKSSIFSNYFLHAELFGNL